MKRKLFQFKILNIIMFVFSSLLLITCNDKKFTNPWDENSNLNPDDWRPKNLTIENVSITEKKLIWTYEDRNIEGFKIERRISSGIWDASFPILNKDIRSFADTTVIPDSSFTYEYRLFAFAGNNQSNGVTKAIKIVFPSPSALQVIANNETTATLSWQDNSNGEEGFLIERSIDNINWEFITSTTANSVTFLDNNFPIFEKVYYRISAFLDNYHSAFDETFISRIPLVQTSEITNIDQTSATCGGNIISEGGLPLTARGVCWSTLINPDLTNSITTNDTESGNFTGTITGLFPLTTYFVRAYATNIVGTIFGENMSFTTLYGVTDFDGNVYATVIIGTQEWMTENLKVKHYSNGDIVPNIANYSQWADLSTGAYCWYSNDEVTYRETYGALYNYYAVADSRNLCPTGYHIPSDNEWIMLINYLDGGSVAGGKMKETGTVHWQSPNTGATNESGFIGLPGGYRDYDGTFFSIGASAYWWSSTEDPTNNVWFRNLSSDNANVYRNYGNKKGGLSLRCVRD